MRTRTWNVRPLWLVSLAVQALVVLGCGGGAAAMPLGQEVVVEHAPVVGSGFGPATTLAITVTAVRTGTIAELEAGGYTIDDDQRSKTPVYVDARFENRGTQPIDRTLRVSLEDQDGRLISAVVVFDYGGAAFAPCPKIEKGEMAPGETVDTCTLFLVAEGRTPTKVSFLPSVPGKETNFIYWSAN